MNKERLKRPKTGIEGVQIGHLYFCFKLKFKLNYFNRAILIVPFLKVLHILHDQFHGTVHA